MRRDYNIECKDNQERKYAYHFDLDVMHPYMVQAFTPFLKKGNALELGCFQGAFTARIANLFDTVTCVEASGEANTGRMAGGAWSIARCMPECKRAFQTDCGKDGTDRFERGRNRSRT